MYLYLSEKDGFETLDEGLKRVFGQPEFVMVLDLKKRDKLARVDLPRVIEELQDKGYYLQMPPQPHKLNTNTDD